MKKILLYAAMVLLSVTSCLKFEEPKSLEVVNAGAPAVEVSGVTENTFTATITPAAGTNFYAYAVLEGEVNPKVSASNLLKVKVGSNIAEGLVDVKNEATKTLALKGLVGNTKYTVYAAATNEQGQVASVTTLEVLTDDKTAPSIKAKAISKVGQIQFTEPVKLVSGKKAWVTYYKIYDPTDSVTMEIPAKNMAVKGAVLQLTPPEHIPGAYTIYTYEEGLVTDYVGQKCPAQTEIKFEAHYDIFYEDSVVVKGVGGRIPTEKWDLVWKDQNKAGDTVIYFSDPTKVEFVFKTVPEIGNNKSSRASFIYQPMFEASMKQLSATDMINESDTTISVIFKTNPQLYTDLTLKIAEGSYMDLYGNINKAFEYEQIASYIPCVSKGIEGVYMYDMLDGSGFEHFYVKEVDDTSALVYNLDPYFNMLGIDGVLKAKIDQKAGTLSIPYGQMYYEPANVGFYGIELTRAYPEYDGVLLPKGEMTFEFMENGWMESSDMYTLASIPEPAEGEEDKDVYFQNKDVKVYSIMSLLAGYKFTPMSMFYFIKVSNDLPSGLSASTPKNYVELKPLGTLNDLNKILKGNN